VAWRSSESGTCTRRPSFMRAISGGRRRARVAASSRRLSVLMAQTAGGCAPARQAHHVGPAGIFGPSQAITRVQAAIRIDLQLEPPQERRAGRLRGRRTINGECPLPEGPYPTSVTGVACPTAPLVPATRAAEVPPPPAPLHNLCLSRAPARATRADLSLPDVCHSVPQAHLPGVPAMHTYIGHDS
jgi:hypothetical protein